MGTRIHSNRELLANPNGTIALDSEGTLYRVVKPSLPGFPALLFTLSFEGTLTTTALKDVNQEVYYYPPLQILDPAPF